MAYLGKDALGILSKEKVVDTMTGNGSTTTLALTGNPTVVHNIEVYVDGVAQYPNTDYTLSGTTLTFTTAPGVACKVVAVSGNDVDIGNPKDRTITSVKIQDNSVTDSKIPSNIPTSKLTGGVLPAINGSNLTNLPSAWPAAVTSDPATDTNPSGGVGTIWINKTTGQMYVCTDATTDENVWVNVGKGSGDIEPYSFMGSTKGYAMAGYSTAAGSYTDINNRFSLVTDGDAADVGNMTTTGKAYGAGFHSMTHGYTLGGIPAPSNDFTRMAFASEGDSVSCGNLPTASLHHSSGHSTETHGYSAGGYNGSQVTDNVIKFAYGSNVTASVGNALTLTRATRQINGCTSVTHGFNHGNEPYHSTIDKFDFATDSDAVGHGDLSQDMDSNCSTSSATHGFSMGGLIGGTSGDSKLIDRFAFASNTTATDWADLHTGRNYGVGVSGKTHGYFCGGSPQPSSNMIQKFQYSSQSAANDIGDLSQTGHGMTSFQI